MERFALRSGWATSHTHPVPSPYRSAGGAPTNVAAERRAQHSAFFLGVLVITIGGVLIYFDKDVQGLAAILGTLATLAGVFVYGRYQQAQERKRKAE